jgi:hypothetical protein
MVCESGTARLSCEPETWITMEGWDVVSSSGTLKPAARQITGHMVNRCLAVDLTVGGSRIKARTTRIRVPAAYSVAALRFDHRDLRG